MQNSGISSESEVRWWKFKNKISEFYFGTLSGSSTSPYTGTSEDLLDLQFRNLFVWCNWAPRTRKPKAFGLQSLDQMRIGVRVSESENSGEIISLPNPTVRISTCQAFVFIWKKIKFLQRRLARWIATDCIFYRMVRASERVRAIISSSEERRTNVLVIICMMCNCMPCNDHTMQLAYELSPIYNSFFGAKIRQNASTASTNPSELCVLKRNRFRAYYSFSISLFASLRSLAKKRQGSG